MTHGRRSAKYDSKKKLSDLVYKYIYRAELGASSHTIRKGKKLT